MLTVVNAIIPVFMIIALGLALRRLRLAPEEAWVLIDRLNYFVLFPALLVKTLALADLGALDVAGMGGALFAAILTMGLLVKFVRPLLGVDGPQYTSVFQGAIRWNGFVALAIVAALYGEAGKAAAAVAFAFLVPTANIMSVTVLTRHAGGNAPGLRSIALLIARNPLVLGCLGGILLNLSGIGLPGPALPFVDVLGSAALALGLISVGAGLRPAGLGEARRAVAATTALKLIVMPGIVLAWCLAFGVSGIELSVAMVCGAVPGATASYVLARQLGGDAGLMASLITASTLGAIVSMPLIIWALEAFA